ncbi:MAG TPA: hypothetical protein VNC22_08395 [Sporichthya sp.]|nr:hypothetical protein [Sporichthya sp.]
MTARRAAGFACCTLLPWLAVVALPPVSAVLAVAACMYCAPRLVCR